MSAAILAQIQDEAFAWQRKNFGEPNALVMICGMFEEYSEALEAISDTDDYIDGVSDCCIFLMQFCSILGWDIGTIWLCRHAFEMPSRPWPILLGRISHHYVKGRVSHYRGTQEEHDGLCHASVGALLRHWDEHLASMGRDFIACVEATWAKVSKRDWSKERAANAERNPLNEMFGLMKDEPEPHDTERPPAFAEEPDTFSPVSITNDSDELDKSGVA